VPRAAAQQRREDKQLVSTLSAKHHKEDKMRTTVKLQLVALTAALLLGSAVSSASARSLSTSSQTLRVTWTNLEFTNEFGFGFVRCAVTFEGSFHSRTIAKVVNSLIGAITRADFRACTGGEVIPRTETLPWHLQYGGFSGTLPNITALTLAISRMRLRKVISGCDADFGSGTDQVRHTAAIGAGGVVNSLTPSNDRLTNIRTNSGFCPTRLGFRNTSTSLTALNSASRITLTLI
jgi:hypothetical protein